MEWYSYILYVLAGLFAGFINMLAGSGSILILALLMFLGMPAPMANGTLRIAILMQNIVGVASFKKQKVFNYKEGMSLALPAIVGSIFGAMFAVNIDKEIMEKTIGGILIVLFFIVLYKPDAWVKGQVGKIGKRPSLSQYIIFFFIGFYGGFIQAGVGFFLLAGLVLGSGFNLVKANAIKIFIILLYTVFALAVFIYNDQVDYKIGFIIGFGNMLGAWLGTKFAVSWGAKYVRYILMGVIILASIKFLGIFDLVMTMLN
ncbi:sulfite exporter TauE/SafE family protein [Ancylomarina sp. 16SWW S1-10-2]|uniref:sulfite exporter TauE/SafE family protein n=1 Tax=Ancylomarina sp. 16SWW S1-10-2 TaxID=2499681 RepID=UPI0012AD74B8|nr:sulfite exporter TauE/SafE family protein [Ancylomarina sp. 16SWW S1-10-2]MRT93108.1 sulfite exporter TauE/SafE family protein [Ancylomarina sp. 16SWW S1-10-2]